jgi:hypothetical protein
VGGMERRGRRLGCCAKEGPMTGMSNSTEPDPTSHNYERLMRLGWHCSRHYE